MRDFVCSHCNQKHKFFFEVEFGLPRIIGDELHSGNLASESSERWFIIQNKYFLIKGKLKIPIDNFDKDFDWLVWVLITEKDFHEYFDLLSTDKTEGWSKKGALAAELNFLNDSFGLKVILNQKGKDSFPIVSFDQDSELAKMQQEKISEQQAIQIMEFLYHDELK
jgi:hypothetical protein